MAVLLLALLPAAAMAAPPARGEVKVYAVQKDDGLSKIADKEYGDPYAWVAIIYYNNRMAKEDETLTAIKDLHLLEVGEPREVYANPLHPYTQALLAAVPVPNPYQRRTQSMLEGEIPNPINPPPGCRFYPRCPIARPDCSQEEPELRQVRPGHQVACHYA